MAPIMRDSHNTHQPATILVVDDTPDNLMLMAELLKDKYRVKLANHGEGAAHSGGRSAAGSYSAGYHDARTVRVAGG